MKIMLAHLLAFFLCVSSAFAQSEAVSSEAVPSEAATWKVLFGVLPSTVDNTANPITPAKVALGKRLFSDTRLSESNKLSCNTCHDLETFGVDNDKTSVGHNGQRGLRNSPTVYNAALHIAQFWDGRAADVEEQALGPVMNPVEMAMPTEQEAVRRLSADPEYVSMFKLAFPDEDNPVSFKNMGKAIGAFERTLMTPGRFDRFLEGDSAALNEQEVRGLKTFVEVGCTACHNGAAVGGRMFNKLGLVKPYKTTDLGRYEVTKDEADRFVFKVPSLRNVAKTGPYFHDGSIDTLERAVQLMAEHQLGRTLTDAQLKDIVAFLHSLTGDLPKR